MNASFQGGPEARVWLQKNGHDSALAHNRFGSTAAALEFVELLYASGAERVFIPSDTIVADEEELEIGGPYSDHLVIEISDSRVPPALEHFYRSEATIDGWHRTSEWLPIIDGRFLLLWWN